MLLSQKVVYFTRTKISTIVHHLSPIVTQQTCWWAAASATATGGRRRTTEVGPRTGFGRRRWRWNELDVRWRQVASSRCTISTILCITTASRIRTRSPASWETESYKTYRVVQSGHVLHKARHNITKKSHSPRAPQQLLCRSRWSGAHGAAQCALLTAPLLYM